MASGVVAVNQTTPSSSAKKTSATSDRAEATLYEHFFYLEDHPVPGQTLGWKMVLQAPHYLAGTVSCAAALCSGHDAVTLARGLAPIATMLFTLASAWKMPDFFVKGIPPSNVFTQTTTVRALLNVQQARESHVEARSAALAAPCGIDARLMFTPWVVRDPSHDDAPLLAALLMAAHVNEEAKIPTNFVGTIASPSNAEGILHVSTRTPSITLSILPRDLPGVFLMAGVSHVAAEFVPQTYACSHEADAEDAFVTQFTEGAMAEMCGLPVSSARSEDFGGLCEGNSRPAAAEKTLVEWHAPEQKKVDAAITAVIVTVPCCNVSAMGVTFEEGTPCKLYAARGNAADPAVDRNCILEGAEGESATTANVHTSVELGINMSDEKHEMCAPTPSPLLATSGAQIVDSPRFDTMQKTLAASSTAVSKTGAVAAMETTAVVHASDTGTAGDARSTAPSSTRRRAGRRHSTSAASPMAVVSMAVSGTSRSARVRDARASLGSVGKLAAKSATGKDAKIATDHASGGLPVDVVLVSVAAAVESIVPPSDQQATGEMSVFLTRCCSAWTYHTISCLPPLCSRLNCRPHRKAKRAVGGKWRSCVVLASFGHATILVLGKELECLGTFPLGCPLSL